MNYHQFNLVDTNHFPQFSWMNLVKPTANGKPLDSSILSEVWIQDFAVCVAIQSWDAPSGGWRATYVGVLQEFDMSSFCWLPRR